MLKNHYENKIKLNKDDIRLADQLWRLYCENDHTLFKKYTTITSSFPYLSSCISAHLKRFPSVKSGLNVLETNILEIIHKQKIKNERQLVGYVLQYQGYYGFGDLQIQNIIHKLASFFETKNGQFVLNRKGYQNSDSLYLIISNVDINLQRLMNNFRLHQMKSE